MNYIRPLSEIIYIQPISKEKTVKESKIVARPVGEFGVRQRIKKKFINVCILIRQFVIFICMMTVYLEFETFDKKWSEPTAYLPR